MTHEDYMRMAIEKAHEAYDAGEVPVGCVVVDGEGRVIGSGRNRREETHLATAHAETAAMDEACAKKGDWRLSDCALYVTLEPCPMCAGAMINARIGAVYYGAKDELTGSCGSVVNLFMENYGCKTKVVGGVLREECASVLADFFKGLRADNSK